MEISQVQLVLHLLAAAGLAGVLGIERELSDQPAGFRTHMLVGVGSALFAVISAYGFDAVVGQQENVVVRADPTRVAAQIVTGIGFLGGGAILKYGATVRGLTTAASLWVTAAVGTAAGIGMLLIAAATTAIALLTLAVFRPIRALIRRYGLDRVEFSIQTDGSIAGPEIIDDLAGLGITLHEARVDRQEDGRSVVLHTVLPPGVRPEQVAQRLERNEHVQRVDWTT
jgi:putative Mg2+ transporter-C (MgtC) family protein